MNDTKHTPGPWQADVAKKWDAALRRVHEEDTWPFQIPRDDLRTLVDAALDKRWSKADALLVKLRATEAQVAAMREALERIGCLNQKYRLVQKPCGFFTDLPDEETCARCTALAPTAGTDWEQRVRAEEREACALLVEDTDVVAHGSGYTRSDDARGTLYNAAAAIRARGKK